jgi:hypothetical protein
MFLDVQIHFMDVKPSSTLFSNKKKVFSSNIFHNNRLKKMSSETSRFKETSRATKRLNFNQTIHVQSSQQGKKKHKYRFYLATKLRKLERTFQCV